MPYAVSISAFDHHGRAVSDHARFLLPDEPREKDLNHDFALRAVRALVSRPTRMTRQARISFTRGATWVPPKGLRAPRLANHVH